MRGLPIKSGLFLARVDALIIIWKKLKDGKKRILAMITAIIVTI